MFYYVESRDSLGVIKVPVMVHKDIDTPISMCVTLEIASRTGHDATHILS